MTEKIEAKQDKIDESKKTWIQIGLSICTALGATVFLLTGALGSGSYKELFWEELGKWIESALFTLVSLFAVMFCFAVYWTATTALNKKPTEKIESFLVNELHHKSKSFFKRATLVFSVVALALLLLYRFLNEDAVFIIVTVAGLVVAAGFFAYAFTTVLKEVLAQDWIGYTVVTLFLLGLGLVLYNHYRDVQKSARISDSEYCYWISAANSQNDDVTCRKLSGFDAYRVVRVPGH